MMARRIYRVLIDGSQIGHAYLSRSGAEARRNAIESRVRQGEIDGEVVTVGRSAPIEWEEA